MSCKDSNNKQKTDVSILAGLDYEANIETDKVINVKYIDSIPEEFYIIQDNLFATHEYYFRKKRDSAFGEPHKPIVLINDKNDNRINGKYIYQNQDLEKILNKIKANSLEESYSLFADYKPKGFIALGMNDLQTRTNYKEALKSKRELNAYYDNAILIDTFPFVKYSIKIPELISLKIDYKFLIVFLHEMAHSLQHSKMEDVFINLNNKDNYDKKFIIELNADYIVGIFYAQLVYEQLFGEYRQKKDNPSYKYNYNELIDFNGIDKKYNFSVDLRQSRSKKIKMFKKIGEALFYEMLSSGDLLFGQKNHHGTNADRATAFYNGYIDALSQPHFYGTYLSVLIDNDLKKRINNYNKISEPWN